jgi:uncharacterized protein (DUF983 family)
MKGTMSERTRRDDPEELSVGRGLRLYRRAVMLRCPHCGSGPVLASWFRMRPHCGTCGLRTERGEEDFFLGSMMFNLILSEGLFALVLIAWIISVWPNVPWDLLQYLVVVLMVVAPFVFLPFSRMIWLASDMLIRPVTEEEMQWYRENRGGVFRPFAER